MINIYFEQKSSSSVDLMRKSLYYLALKNYTAAKLHSLRVTFIDDWSFAM